MTPLAAFEEITGACGVAPRIEALLPIGVRHRQLRVRTLLAGMMLTQADCRPAHLTRVRDTLIALPADDQVRLGVTEDWAGGPHLLTYRQTERTFGLVAGSAATTPAGCRRAGCSASAMPCSRHPSQPDSKKRQPVAGGGLDGPGILLPAPAARHQRLRRPRSVLGAPQEQPAAHPR